MGLTAHQPTIDYLIDLIIDVQTVRSCQTAAELDPEFTPEGYCYPNHRHLGAGSIALLKARPRMSEILRIVPGSSLVVAPSDRDLAAPELAAGLEESFSGGGYTALQRSALLQMVGTTFPRHSTAENRPSNSMPMAACLLGAAVCGAASTAII
jgi:4-hydroxyphenylacetate 3-monooxygenase